MTIGMITLALGLALAPAAAQASPQQALHAYLVQHARAAVRCGSLLVAVAYCHPRAVTGSAADTAKALNAMRQVDALMKPCIAWDSQSCLIQGGYAAAVQRLGWCHFAMGGVTGSTVVLWERCGHGAVTIYKPTE